MLIQYCIMQYKIIIGQALYITNKLRKSLPYPRPLFNWAMLKREKDERKWNNFTPSLYPAHFFLFIFYTLSLIFFSCFSFFSIFHLIYWNESDRIISCVLTQIVLHKIQRSWSWIWYLSNEKYHEFMNLTFTRGTCYEFEELINSLLFPNSLS